MYKVDIVFIQGGKFFHAIEEDAEYMEKEFKWSKHDSSGRSPWFVCSCPSTQKMEDFIIKKMTERRIASYGIHNKYMIKFQFSPLNLSSITKELSI